MQHPQQGLKMQPWGWAGAEGRCPNYSGCQSGILPFPSSPSRPGWLGRLQGAEQHAAPSWNRCPLPTPTPPRPPQPRPGAAGSGGSRARRPSGAYLCDSHAETPGRGGGAGAACGGGAGVRRGPKAAAGTGSGAAGRAPRVPPEAGPSLGPRSGRAARRDRSSALARRSLLMSAPNVHL